MTTRRRAPWLALSLSLVVAFAVVLPAATASATPPHYPVTWSFLPLAFEDASSDGPNVAPAGSNVPCTLTAAHPYPVILAHGLLANQNDDWATLAPFLADNGYCVYSATFGNNVTAPRPIDQLGGLSTMESSAHQLAWFVQLILSATHASKVDIVGHSEGGTYPDYYIKFLGGWKVVAHFVSISGLPHGDTLWGVSSLYDLGVAAGLGPQLSSLVDSFCQACPEFFSSSAFMKALDAPNVHATSHEAATCPFDGAAVAGVSYTSIGTRYDELVQPYNSDFMDPRCANVGLDIGVHNITVQTQCATDFADHLSIESDQVAAQDVLNALDPAHAKRVPCVVTLPSVG